MREALWHVKCAAVFLVQLDGNILEVARAFRAQIYNDVEDRAACATHQLGLRCWGELEMQPPQRALLKVVGDICLRDKWLESMSGEFFLAERTRKEASCVFPSFKFNNIGTPELCFSELHRIF